METVTPLENSQTVKPKRKSGCMKYFFTMFLILLLLAAGLGWWKYYYNYSDGNRTGLLQKLSHKGNLFKTWEGELILSSVISSNNMALASEKFYFSVESDSLAKVLQRLEGRQVKIQYVQKKGTLPWRGESTYIAEGAEEFLNSPVQQQVQPAQQLPMAPPQLPVTPAQ